MAAKNQSQNDPFGMKLDFHETGILFDGNIQKQTWIKANDNVLRSDTYNYDFSKRLKSATYQSSNSEDFNLPTISYDKNGNVLSLARKGKIGNNFNLLDDLTYTYLGNKLLKVEDAVSDTSKNYFNNRNIGTNDFAYDDNGNLKKDSNENISQINYDTFLNQPIEVQKSDGSWENSFYDGSGHLFKRTNSLGITWTYVGNIIYRNDTIYQIGTPEGRVVFDTLGNPNYQFEYRDLTGNLRLLYQDPTIGNPSVRMAPEIVQSQDYEPFGVGFNEYFGSASKSRFGYSNHEIVDDLGLNRIDFGARVYSQSIGRFLSVDALSEHPNQSYYSPYNAFWNNPIMYSDTDGNCPSCPQGEEAAKVYAEGAQVNNNQGSWTWTGTEWQTNQAVFSPSQTVINNEETYLNQGHYKETFLEKAANSDKLITTLLYNTVNDAYLTLQGFDFDLLGKNYTNPLTGKKAFTNLDGSPNYNPISGLVNTLSYAIPTTKIPAGLGAIKPLNTAQFSKTFQGSLSRLAPQFRGSLNRYYNKSLDWLNSQISGGKVVFKGKSVISNKEE